MNVLARLIRDADGPAKAIGYREGRRDGYRQAEHDYRHTGGFRENIFEEYDIKRY